MGGHRCGLTAGQRADTLPRGYHWRRRGYRDAQLAGSGGGGERRALRLRGTDGDTSGGRCAVLPNGRFRLADKDNLREFSCTLFHAGKFCRNDPCVVEYHERIAGQISAKIGKHIVRDRGGGAVNHHQPRLVAVLRGSLRYQLLWQIKIIIGQFP